MTVQDHSVEGSAGTESNEEEPTIAERIEPIVDAAAPIVGEHGRKGTFSFAAGGITILKAIRTIPRSKSRALARFLVGAGWIAIGVLQRKRLGGSNDEEDDTDGGEPSGTDEEEEGSSMGTRNQRPRTSFAGDEAADEEDESTVEELSEVETATEPAEAAGPSPGDAVPSQTKTDEPGTEPEDETVEVDEPDDSDETERIDTDDERTE
ncbi:hypothetical protein [Natronorarus salvus]|uniref:hypothetical protein n=1 Tax=Natronorarus salvus TaxID=3117733 RepID=UPI002F26B2CC